MACLAGARRQGSGADNFGGALLCCGTQHFALYAHCMLLSAAVIGSLSSVGTSAHLLSLQKRYRTAVLGLYMVVLLEALNTKQRCYTASQKCASRNYIRAAFSGDLFTAGCSCLAIPAAKQLQCRAMHVDDSCNLIAEAI